MRVVAAAVISIASPTAADPCVVRGDHVAIEAVHVVTDTGEGFTVEVTRAPVVATPRPAGDTTVEIDGDVAFRGTVPRLSYIVKEPVGVAGGTVTLAVGARVIADRAEGDELVGAAVLYSDNWMPGQDRPPQESVAPVRVACARLSLDAVASTRVHVAGDDTWWQPRDNRLELSLRAEPRADAPATSYRVGGCVGNGCLPVIRLATRGDWMKIGRSGEAVTIEGWVPTRELVRLQGEGWGGRTYCGCSDRNMPPPPPPSPGAPPVRARVAIGTTIYRRDGVGAWATVKHPIEVWASLAPARPWVRITGISGLDNSVAGYVKASAVTGPPP